MYSRKVDGKILDMEASGWVYINTFVLYDAQSGSIWYPFHKRRILQCVAGPLSGKVLKEIPSVRTTWKDWYKKHPDSLILIEK